ncbi:DUF6252 family protein [Mangrovimonas sp. YM274]|uniref:DUF6252 family protein n=1 Tax=Mangrovimonas sp. YM274 TaxID=3070660 RepID=UPI0027DC60A7|nr:DUF6252 family protein [Mangrovimonas sp. YM274]WMI69353.1 DUF6252 family protein [Mangrovimonas sp. YM274]
MDKIKYIALFTLALFTVFGCGDDLEFNTPAMLGKKDGELWRAKFYAADIDAGGLVVEGGNSYETLSLVTTLDNVGTYYLGGEHQSEARFKDAYGVTYSTLNAPDPSLQVYPADGEIEIVDFDNSTNTVTGTFKFNAFSEDGMKSVNFIQGEFYRVPLTGGLLVIGGGTSCQQAQQATAEAAAAFAASSSEMPEYADLCNAYKDALVVQINSCGDTSGVLQAAIDALGDCNP